MNGCTFHVFGPVRNQELDTTVDFLKKFTKLEVRAHGDLMGYYHSEFGTGTILSRDKIKSGWAGGPPKQLTYFHATQPTTKISESNKQHSNMRADVRKEGRRRMKV
jgi:hypothetical protein